MSELHGSPSYNCLNTHFSLDQSGQNNFATRMDKNKFKINYSEFIDQ